MKITGSSAAEIFDSIRFLSQSGQLQPGHTLPPVRDLAVALSVNRNTVAAAYKRLVGAGIARAQGRLGTVLCQPAPLGELEGAVPGSPLVDLASGNPNPAWLPDLAEALAQRPYRHRLYGEPPVAPALDAYARRWFAAAGHQADNIDLTHGAVDAVERLLAAHLVPGDRVAVENPCFLSSINTLRIAGLRAVGVAVDDQGLHADALEAELVRGVQAVIVTPRAHNPTGCNLSAARTQALRAVLARHPHVLVIVDDHFALLSDAPYHNIVPDCARRWAVIRSLSKALGPDLRLALVTSDAQTSARLRLRLAPGAGWVSHVLQDIAAACLSSPAALARIAQARQDYARRRQGFAAALAEHGLLAPPGQDGLNLWLPLRSSLPQPSLPLDLARRGWLVRSGDAFSLPGAAMGLRLTTACLDADQAPRLAYDLHHCLA